MAEFLVSQMQTNLTRSHLSTLQEKATLEGRACVVSALIQNETKQLFFQKRGAENLLFPNCWDVVGGHVESGETLEQALPRELKEETGWSLLSLGTLLHVFDWQIEREGGLSLKREFAFLVRAQGDFDQPVIESKFSECRWLHETEVDILMEHRQPSDTAIYELAQLAFQVARNSTNLSRTQQM